MAENNTVRFRFERDQNYRIIPVNGVWGGLTARGDVKADFFHESHPVPEEVINALTPEGRIGDELTQVQDLELHRTLLVGMMLTVEQADSIGRWLQAQAAESRRLRGDEDEKPSPVTTH